MARSEHGGQLVCNWRLGYPSFLPWLCGFHFDHFVLQSPRYLPSRILLDIWASIRVQADGVIKILLWLLWRQD